MYFCNHHKSLLFGVINLRNTSESDKEEKNSDDCIFSQSFHRKHLNKKKGGKEVVIVFSELKAYSK